MTTWLLQSANRIRARVVCAGIVFLLFHSVLWAAANTNEFVDPEAATYHGLVIPPSLPKSFPGSAVKPANTADVSIDQLIQNLAATKFEQREEATRKLESLGDRALSALNKATSNRDPEIAERAQTIVDHLMAAKFWIN